MARRGRWYSTQTCKGLSSTYTQSFYAEPPGGPINLAKYVEGDVQTTVFSSPATQGYRAVLRRGDRVRPLATYAGRITIGRPQVQRYTYFPPIFGQGRHEKSKNFGGPLTQSPQFLSYSGETFGYTYDGSSASSSSTPGVTLKIPISYQAEIQNAILGKLGNAAMQIMVTAAEYKKTASTLVQSVNRLIGAVGEIATGKPGKHLRDLGITMFGNHPTRVYYRDQRGRKRVSRVWKRDKDNVTLIAESANNMSQRYLEARFGLMPVFYDIDGASRIAAGWDRNKFIGTLRHVSLVPEDQSAESGGYVRTSKGELKLVHRLAFHMRDSFANEMNKIGMDITSLLNTAWELIPYTWLIDKFWNIGNYTMALSGARAWTFDYGSISWKGTYDCNTVRKTDVETLYEVSSLSLQIQCFQRTVLSAFPLPMVPRLVADLGLRDALDILSLGLTKIYGSKNQLIK